MSRNINVVPVREDSSQTKNAVDTSTANSSKSVNRQMMNRTLLMMPDDILTIVLSMLCYDDISQLRVVCHRFNRISQRLLNRGLQKLERYHADCLKKLKAQLPRRESERRQHPLARHCDILSAVETRLSLLAMTYSKYIDFKVCCFIPGKVIDEAMYVLTLVMESREAPRTHDLLQELRDISSMAMEHFDEKIAPGLKKKLGQAVNANTVGAALTLKDLPTSTTLTPSTSGRYLHKMHHHFKSANYNLNFNDVVIELKVLKLQLMELRKAKLQQDKKITQQQQIVVELTGKITSQNERITEQERKMALLEQQLRNAPRPSGQAEVFFTIDDVGGNLEDGQEEKGSDADESPVKSYGGGRAAIGSESAFGGSKVGSGDTAAEGDSDGESRGDRGAAGEEEGDDLAPSISTRGASQRSSRKRKVATEGEKASENKSPGVGVKKKRQRNDKGK